ncbi:MAG TPA: sugar ABC transporter permease, partial [Anaerolineae bacterium]|nr:sugar ABC transporter permease [Anaerolineae bacterium]
AAGQSAVRKSFLRPAVKEEITGWLFASPWIIGFLLFTAGPMLFSLYTSFTEYNLLSAPEWIGTENYADLFGNDPFFWKALGNTFWMVVVKIPLVVVTSIFIALLLNLDLKGEKTFRTIIYLPNVLSGIAAIFLWQWILSPNGLFNSVLGLFGIDGPAWFVDPSWTKPGMVVMGMWWIGGNIIIYLAGLKGIPNELYEAAAIDGAQRLTTFRYITLPLLTPTIFFQVVTGIIGTFQIFTTAYILSGKDVALGGPGQSMLFYVLYLYNRAFGKVGAGGLQMGYASAMAWILFVIILLITLVQLRLAKRWVYYETGE